MAWSLPQIPPELAQALLMKQPAQGPPVSVPPANPPLPAPNVSAMPISSRMTSPSMAAPAIAPPMPSMSGMPAASTDPMRSAFGIPRMPSAPSPPPSDDPGITGGMPKLPTAPDLSNSPVLGLAKQYSDTLAKESAITPPDPNQLKPHWYDKILGGATSAVASLGGDPRAAAQAGQNVTNRRMINAAREYNAQTKPLQTQLENIKGGAGLVEAAGKIPSENLHNQLAVAGEGREQASTAETARHNQEAEATAQQNADTQQSGQESTQEHEQNAEELERQRLAQEGKYQTGELAARGAETALHSRELESKLSTIPDLKSLDQEEKLDNQALDKAQKESADAIKSSHSGIGSLQAVVGNTQEKALAADQARWDAERAAHAQSFQQRRAALSGKGGATANTSAPTPQTHSWSKSAWAQAHPGQNADAAEQAAKAQNFEVLP